MELSPEDPSGWNFLVDVRHKQAVMEYAFGHESLAGERLESALRTARSAAFTSRESANSLGQLAAIVRNPVLAEFRDLEESLRAAQRAVTLSHGNSAGPLHELALTLEALGQKEQAIKMLNKALQVLEPGENELRRKIEHQLMGISDRLSMKNTP